MQSALAGLSHDAAAVYRFVDFVEQYCTEQQINQSYARPSALFFRKITALAADTKGYLQSLVADAVAREGGAHDKTLDSDWYRNRRDALLTIKKAWKELQGYVKPAADAHALRVPAALVELAVSQLKSIPKMGRAAIAVLLTPELNYFQTSHTNLDVAAAALRRKIHPFVAVETAAEKDAAKDEQIGFVELPYSQGPSFFTNLLVYHELGHFVFEELYPEDRSHQNPLKTASELALRDVYKRRFTHMPKYKRAGAITLVSNWAQEVFCDLFAIRLIGPAFSLSAIEMFSLVGLLSQTNTIKFTPTHPAPACRFREHLKLLEDDGWWPEVRTLQAEHRSVIEHLSTVAQTDYRLYLDEVTAARDQRTIEAFMQVLPSVRSLATEIVGSPHRELEAFRSQRRRIQQCFMHGIVPSRLIQGKTIIAGHPVAVINASFCFYLSSLSDLMARLEGQDANDIKQRSHWTKRLEMWTIKAIEDYQLSDGSY